ncbi:cysteine-rich CWC family protein [Enterovibrio paralichthyis]|uniref:cysteine-rich CWC family protein n=1 Tax=Enterovibrio paralichthyis TaxID=2853805 RepID=UPI001C438029|nr:cysteine-rich CWC family protein [Enterovibrio paralichthyis]MBV7299145.1 cysteine-rich CWC family protein [Enterovibrio paralichthyis]
MSQCPSCGQTLKCTAESGQCWCMQYPNILPTGESDNLACLCETCLSQRINQKLESLYQEYSTNDLIRLAKPYRNDKALVEGLDYTVERGLYVFSAWYHLKRGTCCGNGCRNCPYGKTRDLGYNNVG